MPGRSLSGCARVCSRLSALIAAGALAGPLTLSSVARAEPPFANGPGYARTTWATVHGDSRNSDYVPLKLSTTLREAWRVLEGSGSWTAPSVAADGRLFVTTGRGRGTSHLHAISPAGQVVWESAPYESDAQLGPGAVTSAPLLGDDGDVYLGDADQFWAFHPDGRVKWVTDVKALGVEGPFVTGIFVGGHVGGVSIHGQVLLLRRSDGALAVPVLDLPGGPSPDGPPVPDWLWEPGLMDRETRERAERILLGYRYEVTNSPAVHPETGRIYLLAGGRSLEEGLFYGVDLVGDQLRIAFETVTDPGTGTSPAISSDGRRVYAFDGKGDVLAFDARSGEVLFSAAVGAVQASPSVAPDGSVYALARERLVKLDGRSGEILWERSYHELGREHLPTVSSWWPFVESGEPIGAIDSVVTISEGVLWTSVVMGWEMDVFGREFIHQHSTRLVALDPATGDLLADYPIPDTSEGGISVGHQGQLYLDILAIQASIAAGAPYRWLLPGAMRTPPPRGGIVAFEPVAPE